MWKKLPNHFNNMGTTSVIGQQSQAFYMMEETIDKDLPDLDSVLTGQKRKIESELHEHGLSGELLLAGLGNERSNLEQFTSLPIMHDQINDQTTMSSTSKHLEEKVANTSKMYKFKLVGTFKEKDDFMELLMGHSYCNQYSSHHHAVHSCIIHQEVDGTSCFHQFRICEKQDSNGVKTFELYERGEHFTLLRQDLNRGIHPLMVVDVDEMIVAGISPSFIIKALKSKYEGQAEMLSLIPKKTQIVSRKITTRVKGSQKRCTFPYVPPVRTTPYVPVKKTASSKLLHKEDLEDYIEPPPAVQHLTEQQLQQQQFYHLQQRAHQQQQLAMAAANKAKFSSVPHNIHLHSIHAPVIQQTFDGINYAVTNNTYSREGVNSSDSEDENDGNDDGTNNNKWRMTTTQHKQITPATVAVAAAGVSAADVPTTVNNINNVNAISGESVVVTQYSQQDRGVVGLLQDTSDDTNNRSDNNASSSNMI